MNNLIFHIIFIWNCRWQNFEFFFKKNKSCCHSLISDNQKSIFMFFFYILNNLTMSFLCRNKLDESTLYHFWGAFFHLSITSVHFRKKKLFKKMLHTWLLFFGGIEGEFFYKTSMNIEKIQLFRFYSFFLRKRSVLTYLPFFVS